MASREQNMELIKKVAGGAFIIAFLMSLVLFAGIGRSYIPQATAKIIFIAAGAVGLFLNLLTFQSGKFHPVYNFTYWSGSIVLFTGLVFLLMRWKYSQYIILVGMIVIGVSFFLPKKMTERKDGDEDLLDNQL